MSIKRTIRKVKDKVIDKTATVVANTFMGGGKANRMIRQADKDIAILKEDRKYGGNFIEPDPTNPAFQTRSLANEVRYRRTHTKTGAKL